MHKFREAAHNAVVSKHYYLAALLVISILFITCTNNSPVKPRPTNVTVVAQSIIVSPKNVEPGADMTAVVSVLLNDENGNVQRLTSSTVKLIHPNSDSTLIRASLYRTNYTVNFKAPDSEGQYIAKFFVNTTHGGRVYGFTVRDTFQVVLEEVIASANQNLTIVPRVPMENQPVTITGESSILTNKGTSIVPVFSELYVVSGVDTTRIFSAENVRGLTAIHSFPEGRYLVEYVVNGTFNGNPYEFVKSDSLIVTLDEIIEQITQTLSYNPVTPMQDQIVTFTSDINILTNKANSIVPDSLELYAVLGTEIIEIAKNENQSSIAGSMSFAEGHYNVFVTASVSYDNENLEYTESDSMVVTLDEAIDQVTQNLSVPASVITGKNVSISGDINVLTNKGNSIVPDSSKLFYVVGVDTTEIRKNLNQNSISAHTRFYSEGNKEIVYRAYVTFDGNRLVYDESKNVVVTLTEMIDQGNPFVNFTPSNPIEGEIINFDGGITITTNKGNTIDPDSSKLYAIIGVDTTLIAENQNLSTIAGNTSLNAGAYNIVYAAWKVFQGQYRWTAVMDPKNWTGL